VLTVTGIFKKGDRVTSVQGWNGTVQRVLHFQSGRVYKVKWDHNEHEGRISAHALRPATDAPFVEGARLNSKSPA
jgi:hypothetical protein